MTDLSPPLFTPSAEQSTAALTIVTKPYVVLTGVPGAGKTTLLKYVISELVEQQTEAEFAATKITTPTVGDDGGGCTSGDKTRPNDNYTFAYEQARERAIAKYPVLATTALAATLICKEAMTWQSWLGIGAPSTLSDCQPVLGLHVP